ncbi:MAG: tRNA (5-methylaminomethyl-2-thiouridine)(34)-methyltransferase MnmD [Bacteroidota bacterium]
MEEQSTQSLQHRAEIITTRDGSHTLWLPALQETYHSTHRAVRESKHVFIEHGLNHWLQQQPGTQLNILEVGLGTGLNALLSWMASLSMNVTINYVALEPFPISREQAQCLNYVVQIAQAEDSELDEDVLQATFEKIHQLPADATTQLGDYFSFQKCQLTLQEFTALPQHFDMVYFDAFAPSRQPDIWEPSVLQKVYEMMKSPGILVTYCAQGQFRRNLKALGMKVENLPGPPGKKEMTRAWRIGKLLPSTSSA